MMAQLCYCSIAGHHHQIAAAPLITKLPPKFADTTFHYNILLPALQCSHKKLLNSDLESKFHAPCAGGGDIGAGQGNGDGDGGNSRWSGGGDSHESNSSWDGFGPIGALINGWRSRVAADPQFPFKVLMEELVGVSSCVIGDMASRPNFGLNELDFVFSTLVVGSILNFVLMYLLAPTMSSSTQSLPGIFANSPVGHMFEPGPYSLVNRLGTCIYKGALFAAVGFVAGLVGTSISNGLINMKKKMDPNFETPNKPPPMVLNATTWAIHMGVSSNLRYQSLNGIEFLLAKGFPPFLFKTSVVFLRCFNNILGGMTFVILARLTGSQSVQELMPAAVEDGSGEEKDKLVNKDDDLQTSASSSK